MANIQKQTIGCQAYYFLFLNVQISVCYHLFYWQACPFLTSNIRQNTAILGDRVLVVSIQAKSVRKVVGASSPTGKSNSELSSKQELLMAWRSLKLSLFILNLNQNHKDITMQNSLASLQTKPHNYKTIFCKFYGEGTCKLGQHCTYAHERREKRKKKASQDYTSQGQLEANISWDNYQLYQYYGQMYNYMQPNYNYDPQFYNIQQNYGGMVKEEQHNYVNQYSSEGNNIRYEITQNNPRITKNQEQSANQNVSNSKLEDKA